MHLKPTFHWFSALMVVALASGGQTRACQENPGKPTISVSGAQAGNANYYAVELPKTGTVSVTISASGDTPCPTGGEKCKCNDQTKDPEADGSPVYTFSKTVGNQDPADGPTVKWDVTSSTGPGEYKFKVTKIDQKYKACAQGWTGGVSLKSNTQASDEVTVLVYKYETETISTTPSDQTRVNLGIGEEVKITITPSSVNASWSLTTGDGGFSSSSGSVTQFNASKSPGSATVRAAFYGINKDTTFSVVAPSGMNSALKSDGSLGTAGPPNNNIGAKSVFDCTVQPTTVSFYNAEFQEKIPGDTWTWPDGTGGSRPAATVPWTTSFDNKTTDTVSSALASINRIKQSGTFVNFSVSIRVPEEYKDKNSNWVAWLPGETHPREYRGSDQKTRVLINASNSAAGAWMGPWQ